MTTQPGEDSSGTEVVHETMDDDLDVSTDDPDLEEREERPGRNHVKPTYCLELPGHIPKGLTTKPREDWNIHPYFFIDGTEYQVIGKVGGGSFGTVHEALEVVGAEKDIWKGHPIPVAVKHSSPPTQEHWEAALLEAKILREMADPCFDGLLPRYISHGVIPPPPGSGIQAEVVLAMTKLPGKSLEFWMYGIDTKSFKSVSIRKMVDGHLPGACGTRRLEHCADMCLELLRTMCPVFSTLGKDVFHRDIAAHNFLIEDVKDNTAKFAVLDFGLAVDAAKWCREWRSRSIGGDPRYWAPPAWMMLACGHQYVANHPDSCWANQYAHRLDHYSFGMLMLEMLFALWKGPKADEDDWAESGELSEQAKSWRSSFLTTRSAWKAWWKKCVHLFQSVHNEGAHKLAAELREKCRNTKQLAIDDHCEFLRATVKKIVAPCAAVPEGEVYKKVSFVLQVASELINPAGRTQWQEIHRRLGSLLGVSGRVESMPSGSSFGSDTDLVVTKVGSNYSDEAGKDAGAMLLRLVQSPFRTDNGAGMALLQQVGSNYSDEADKDAGAMLLRLVQSPLRTDNGAGMALLQQVQAGTLSTEQEQWSSSNYNKGRGQGGWWGGDSYYGNYEWADHRKGAGKYKHKGKTSEKHVWAGWNGSESWWTSTSGEEWLEESQNSWIGRQRSAPQWGRTKKGGKRKSAVRQYEEEAEEEETSKESTGSEHAPQATNARWRQKGKAEGKGKGSGKGKSKTSTAEPKAEQKWNPAAAKRSK